MLVTKVTTQKGEFKVITTKRSEEKIKHKQKGQRAKDGLIVRTENIRQNMETNFMRVADEERRKDYNKKRNEKKYAKRKRK